jgi:hypothetical protein
MHGICLPLARWELHVIGGKAKVYLAELEGVVQSLHEAGSGVLADNLVLVAVSVHNNLLLSKQKAHKGIDLHTLLIV